MILLEASCAAIVLLFVITRARLDDEPWRFLRRLALLAVASWVAEDSVIHAYGFYQYSPRWTLFVDRVPLMVLLIWPVVIHSAWDLICRLRGGPSFAGAAWAAAMVLADASLIEPVAVESGLWSWNAPGIFAVPPIGLLGWSYFAGLCLLVIHAVDRRRASWGWELTLLVVPAALTHPMLLATWWGALRWVSGTIPPWPAVALLWVVSIGLTVGAARSAAGARVPLVEMLLRVPAAGFFFVLLALYGRDVPPLVAWALAFAPPYLVLTARAPRRAVVPSP